MIRVGSGDARGEVSATAGPGEMLRMQQGGKSLCDDEMQAVEQRSLDHWESPLYEPAPNAPPPPIHPINLTVKPAVHQK